MDVSICISSYCGAHRLARLLGSFQAGGVRESDELCVFDDGSVGESAERLRRVVEDAPLCMFDGGSNGPWKKQFHRSETNLGWTEPNARLVARASHDAILLLNDDTLLPAGFMDTLRHLLTALPNVGALAWRSCGMTSGDDGHHSSRPIVGFLQPATHLAAYCMAFHRATFNAVGGLDRRFRHYCSDSDLALRMTLAGHPSYRVWWPLIPHEEGATTKEHLELERPADAARRDLGMWNQKWGRDGETMEREAIARLVDLAR